MWIIQTIILSALCLLANAQVNSRLGNLTVIRTTLPSVQVTMPITNIEWSVPAISLPVFTVATGYTAATKTAIKSTLPSLLSTLSIPTQTDATIDTVSTLMSQAVLRALGNDVSFDSASLINILGPWSEVMPSSQKRFLDEIFCALFSTGALPAYLAAAAEIDTVNFDGEVATDDDNFFLSAVYGNLASSVPVKWVYQAASIPPSVAAMTFGQTVYVNGGRETDFTPDLSTTLSDPFKIYITMIIHEMKHIQQYEHVSYFIPAFGLEYLYEYCMAGFSYENDAMEVEAYATAAIISPLLNTFVRYWKVWKIKGLKSSIGFPTSSSPSSIVFTGGTGTELTFVSGSIQFKSDNICFRIISGNINALRSAASCQMITLVSHNSKSCSFDNPPLGCDWTAANAANAACKAAQDSWKAAEAALAWDCITFAPPPPPVSSCVPHGSCPTNCQMITKIPTSSHSCQFDPPPDGCDWEYVDIHNAECSQERSDCCQ